VSDIRIEAMKDHFLHILQIKTPTDNRFALTLFMNKTLLKLKVAGEF
jgi:hypothetical protein